MSELEPSNPLDLALEARWDIRQPLASRMEIQWSRIDEPVLYLASPVGSTLEARWVLDGAPVEPPEEPEPNNDPSLTESARTPLATALSLQWLAFPASDPVPDPPDEEPPPPPPEQPVVGYWAIYRYDTGAIKRIELGTYEEAVIAEADDPETDILSIPERIDNALYWVDQSGAEPVLALKPRFVFDFDTRTPAVGQPATTLTPLPSGTSVVLIGNALTPAGIEETEYVHAGGPFAFTSNLKAEHRLEFSNEAANYVTEQVVLNVL